jgi:cysteine synthase A
MFSLASAVGNTPLVRLERIEAAYDVPVPLYAKMEMLNPTGSVKVRPVLAMMLDAEETGRLRRGMRIVCPTSGNTGLAVAALAAARGYRSLIIMPASMSLERRAGMLAYGAEVRLTPAAKGMPGAIAAAEAIAAEDEETVILGQFTNPANALSHETGTGPEVLAALGEQLGAFVAGIGTGGTVTGVGHAFQAAGSTAAVVGVEPAASAVLSGEKAGPHAIQGIGAGFVPIILDRAVLSQVVKVENEEAIVMARQLSVKEGISAGISAGAAVAGAVAYAKAHSEFLSGKAVVALLPDTGERYLSTALFESFLSEAKALEVQE